jgi:hypothetical protein
MVAHVCAIRRGAGNTLLEDLPFKEGEEEKTERVCEPHESIVCMFWQRASQSIGRSIAKETET